MKTLFFLICIVISFNCFSQNRSNIWYIGAFNSDPQMRKIGIDFSTGIADTFVFPRELSFFITDASICDTNGNMLLYTNGIWIANQHDEHMLNSTDFNPGYSTDYYGDDGLGWSQAAIILPKPGSSDHYLIFHVTGEEITKNGNYDVQPLHFSASEVDMNLDSGLGGVMPDKKNIHVIEDTVSQGRITACKHANGRDWWVITHKYYSDVYYKILVTPDTMLVTQQVIGGVFKSNDIDGMAVFSPDGLQYAHLNHYDTLEIYQFDRCTGDLSNTRTLILPTAGIGFSEWTLGCSFSPNSRFLYVNTYTAVYQFDTWADSVQASMVKVADWDSSYLPVATWFFMEQLAPDNKIYIATYNGIFYMHVINSPDSLGVACDVQQHGVKLPYPYGANDCVPNFPNYDLGALEGSACDTLLNSVNTTSSNEFKFQLAPNPASDWLNVIYTSKEDALFELSDLYGRKIQSLNLFHYFKNRLLDVSDLPAGIYLGTVMQHGKRIRREKVMVAH